MDNSNHIVKNNASMQERCDNVHKPSKVLTQIHHVKNELMMLQRFGGKNYVINLDCSLKSENSDFFILQHVEHDRPEVSKQEIGIFQLQWYGYCMFKALFGLHKWSCRVCFTETENQEIFYSHQNP